MGPLKGNQYFKHKVGGGGGRNRDPSGPPLDPQEFFFQAVHRRAIEWRSC